MCQPRPRRAEVTVEEELGGGAVVGGDDCSSSVGNVPVVVGRFSRSLTASR